MICVSLVESDRDQCLAACRRYPMVEYRLDRLNVTTDELPTIISAAESCIVTCRRTRSDQSAVYDTAIRVGADFIDLELSDDPDLLVRTLSKAQRAGVQVILSMHDYEGTPPAHVLQEWVDRAAQMNADIVKIACRVRTMEDTLRLLSIYRDRRHADVPKVVLGMGAEGVVTRLFALSMGAPFTFAYPDEGTASAPGQLPHGLMKQFIELLRLGRGRDA